MIRIFVGTSTHGHGWLLTDRTYRTTVEVDNVSCQLEVLDPAEQEVCALLARLGRMDIGVFVTK